MKKGDVLTVSQLAGIMGAKKTSELIPLCHPIALTSVNVDLKLNEEDLAIDIICTVSRFIKKTALSHTNQSFLGDLQRPNRS